VQPAGTWQLGPWADTTANGTANGTREYSVLLDFGTLERRSSPNQYLIAPAGATPRAQPDAESPVFDIPPDRLRDAFLAVIAQAPRTKLLEQSADGMRLLLVQRSAVLRFPDYIDVSILPAADGGSTIALYSRSRFGYSDMGVNKRRVEDWLTALQRQAASR